MVNNKDNEWSNANGCWLKHPFNQTKRNACEIGLKPSKDDKDNCLLKHPFNKEKREACKSGVEYIEKDKEDGKNCFLRHPFNRDKREACKLGGEYVEDKDETNSDEEPKEDKPKSDDLLRDVLDSVGSISGGYVGGNYGISRPSGNTYNTYNQDKPQYRGNDNLGLYILGGAGAIVVTIILIKKFM